VNMNQKIINQICCIALVGWFLWAMQLFLCERTGADSPAELMVYIKEQAQEVFGEAGMGGTPVVVIDAGHGGMDPGKVGVSGSLEKEINLAIAMELKEMLEQNDVTVIMTRTDDAGLYSEADTNKKNADMRARIAVLTRTNPVLAVSIHQNSFTDQKSRGAQVFYYDGSAEGKRGAELIQETMKRELADGNHRVAKANSSYYLLKKSPCPLVIVECGFLSNPAEEKQLCTQEYRRKLAWAIHLGVLEWLGEMER